MQKLIIATSNPGKYKAIKSVFDVFNIELLSLRDVPIDMSNFVEDGKTFNENALKKAKYSYEKTGITSLADDSGIFVNALANELGVKTRRWGAGENASDQEWIDFFLNRMSEFEDKRAKFISNIAIVGNGFEKVFIGETTGRISNKLMAPIRHGLPLSSCFIPNGCDDVFENLPPNIKNKFGHRNKALKTAREWFISAFD